MQIEIPGDVEPLVTAKAHQAGFENVGDYVVSLVLGRIPAETRCHEEDAAGKTASASEWNDQKNARRCELIDRDIQNELNDEERLELANLTDQFRDYRRRHAPLPMETPVRLHAELLEKKRQRESGGRA
ncbi:MAG: hypothetical protein KY475_07625 [Planctomycetes bacterium]|nr:hypothetical protein [Planctomycetota bacterium]